jgi:hypothetical protein
MKFSAAEIIASLSGKNEVVPNFMNVDVHKSVARAVFFATGSSKH